MRVLVADDELKVRRLIRYFLEHEVYDEAIEVIGEARTGGQALELVEQEKPDLVVTDIQMPEVSGLELIREAKKRAPDVSFIIISGYEQFDYAQEALKYGVEAYLLKPVQTAELVENVNHVIEKRGKLQQQEKIHQQMTEDLKEAVQQRRKALLRMLAQGSLPQPLTEQMLRERYRFDTTDAKYVIVIFKTDMEIHNRSESIDFSGLIERQSEQIVQSCVEEYDLQVEYFIQQSRCYLLAVIQDDQMNDLKRMVRQCVYRWKNHYGAGNGLQSICVTAAIGKPTEHPEQLEEAMHTAQQTICSRLLRGIGGVLEYEVQNNHYEARDFFNAAVRKKLQRDIEQFNVEEVLEIIQRMGTHLVSTKDCSGQLILQVVREIVELIVMEVKNSFDAEERQQLEKQILKHIDLCPYARNVFDVLCMDLEDLLRRYEDLNKKQIAKPIEEAKKYVRSHYDQDISQDEVAEAVGLSPTYLSALFKKETGDSFSGFLTETRIHAACDLLLNTNHDIIDITEMVGYNDAKYFTKVFRKVMKVSPSAYRKLYR